MEFSAPAGTNLFDRAKIVGKATPRIDGPLKTTGTAPYAAERHDVAANQAYGFIVGSAIAKGRITSMDTSAARSAPGVLAVVAAPETKPVGKPQFNNAPLFGGNEISHYHQAIACVVAETFEQARAAAALIQTRYDRAGAHSTSKRPHPARLSPRAAATSPIARPRAISMRPLPQLPSNSTRATTPPTKATR